MDKLDSLHQRIKAIHETLKTTEDDDEKKIEAAFESWLINKFKQKLQEKVYKNK
jgi:hypothetical protein